jgi:chaperonin cofactor prefoldin
MSEDLTKKQPQSDSEILKLILTTVQSLDRRLTGLEVRFGSLEARFEKLETRFDRLEARLNRFEAEMREDIRDLNKAVRDLSINQTACNDAIRKMDHNFHEVFERLHIVEVAANQQNSTT